MSTKTEEKDILVPELDILISDIENTLNGKSMFVGRKLLGTYHAIKSDDSVLDLPEFHINFWETTYAGKKYCVAHALDFNIISSAKCLNDEIQSIFTAFRTLCEKVLDHIYESIENAALDNLYSDCMNHNSQSDWDIYAKNSQRSKIVNLKLSVFDFLTKQNENSDPKILEIIELLKQQIGKDTVSVISDIEERLKELYENEISKFDENNIRNLRRKLEYQLEMGQASKQHAKSGKA